MPAKLNLKPKGLNKTIYISFFLSFLALTGSTIFTLLGSLANYTAEQRYLKNALISETAVNIIAGITYFYFLKYLYEDSIPLEGITSVRYLDWVVTTPLLLLSFALYSSYVTNKNRPAGTPFKNVDLKPLLYIIPLNIVMLFFGFLGENGYINKNLAFVLSIGSFAALFYLIWDKYVDGKDKSLKDLYAVFTTVWLLYGVAYYFPLYSKNIAYNILDMISKSAFGIFLWITTITDLDN